MTKIKIVDYKGKVVGNWKVPKTKRQFVWCIIRLVRFYYRCKQANLLTNDVVSIIKDFINSETVKPHLAVAAVSHPEVLQGIQEIRNLTPHDLQEEVVTHEKIRKHASALCSICGVRLKYPAFVVFRRRDGRVVATSDPIGIHCLNHTVGKLRDLITKLEISHEKTEQSNNTSKRRLYSSKTSASKDPHIQLAINF